MKEEEAENFYIPIVIMAFRRDGVHELDQTNVIFSPMQRLIYWR